LLNALYAFIPNDTDYTLFKAANFQGLNFANSHRVTAYHTPLDNLKNADTRTLQHHGENTLGLAKSLGNISLDNIRSPDLAYFNVIGSFMASYPVGAAYVLAAITLLGFALLMGITLRKKMLRPIHLLASFGMVAVLTIVATGAVYGIWKMVNIIHPEYSGMFMGDTYNAVWYRVAFTGLSAFIITGIYIALRKKLALIELTAASILLWFIILAVSLIYIPAGSHILLWPLVFAVVIFALFILKPESSGTIRLLSVLLLSIPALFFMADTLMTVYVGLTLRMVFAAGLVTVLFLILLYPLIDLMLEKGGTLPVYISGIIFIICIIGGSANSGFDSENPKPNIITYGLDADAKKASWLSCDSVLDPWLAQFFKPDDRKVIPEFFPMVDLCLFKRHSFFAAPAPVLDLLPPRADIVSDKTAEKRELKFRISSQRKAGEVILILKTDQGIENISVDGKQLENIDPDSLKQAHRLITTMVDLKNWKIIICKSLPDAGFIISLNCRPGTKIEVRLLDISETLPDFFRWGIKPRAKDMMAGPDFLLQEGILVAKKYLL
jgi:hypothetical protein